MSIFPFPHSVFYPFEKPSVIFIKFDNDFFFPSLKVFDNLKTRKIVENLLQNNW